VLVGVGTMVLGLHERFERRQFALVGLCLAPVRMVLPCIGLAVSFVGCAVSFVGLVISVVAYRILVCLAAVEPSLTFIEFSGPSGVAGLALLGVDVPVCRQVPRAVDVTPSLVSRRFVVHLTISHHLHTLCHGWITVAGGGGLAVDLGVGGGDNTRTLPAPSGRHPWFGRHQVRRASHSAESGRCPKLRH